MTTKFPETNQPTLGTFTAEHLKSEFHEHSVSDVKLEDVAFKKIVEYPIVSIEDNAVEEIQWKSGVMTKLGIIDLDIWKKIIQSMVATAHEEELFAHLSEIVKAHAVDQCRKSESQLQMDALVLYSIRIFEDADWVYYKEFKEKYLSNAEHN